MMTFHSDPIRNNNILEITNCYVKSCKVVSDNRKWWTKIIDWIAKYTPIPKYQVECYFTALDTKGTTPGMIFWIGEGKIFNFFVTHVDPKEGIIKCTCCEYLSEEETQDLCWLRGNARIIAISQPA